MNLRSLIVCTCEQALYRPHASARHVHVQRGSLSRSPLCAHVAYYERGMPSFKKVSRVSGKLVPQAMGQGTDCDIRMSAMFDQRVELRGGETCDG